MKRAAFILVVAAQVLVAACRAGSSTDFFDAVRAGDAEKVKALLQADPKLAEARTEDGSTALHLAALEGEAAVARLLLAGGAQVNARGLREETPLHMAMYDGHREVAEVLLASQADANARNTVGETPLHLAARNGFRELVELLLSQNADPGARDNAGRTPKMAAAEKERWGVTELLTLRVGDYFDLQRFVFEGVKAFPPESLRQALRRTRDFFEVSHPLAQQDTYLDAIQRKVLLGYQHHGFPGARIEARPDARAGRVVVTVEEGPRYVCGEVKVTGAEKVPAAVIIGRLTTSPAPAQSARRAFAFQDKAPSTNPLTQAAPDESDPDAAVWVKGEPAPFSNPDLLRIKERVTDLLAERGFLFPKIYVRIVPDQSARTAELLVEVLEEGPHAVIEHIDVVGNQTNTAEAVLRYLDLKPGMGLSSEVVGKIEDRLWRAARFLSYKVSLGSPEAEGRVPVKIELAEYDKAPPLEQAFSPSDQAQLKMRDWLSKLDESREDMVCTVSWLRASAPELELVLSPRSGLVLSAKDTTRKPAAREEYAVVLKASQIGLYSPIGGRKLSLANIKEQLRAFLSISSKAGAANDNHFDLTLGAGFSHRAGDTPAPTAYRFELTLAPVACVGAISQKDTSSWLQGDVLIRSNATVLLKLNASSGRIIELRLHGEEGTATAQIHFEPGAFERAVGRIEAASAGLPDLGDTNAPLSSALAFLAEEVCSSRYLTAFSHANLASESAAPLAALLSQFKLASILAPLDRLAEDVNGLAGQPGDFSVPYDEGSGKGTRLDTIAVVSRWLLLHSDELFEARSWPWTVLREACFTVQGKARYTDEALTGIYESSATGPLGYLAIADMLRNFQPPMARKFAARGLERLSAADFHHDCRLFFEGNSISSQCCQRLAASLRAQDDEQVEALAKLQSPARGEFIRESSRRLRAAKDQPVLETLMPSLDVYWEQELKAQVAAALKAQAFDPLEAFKAGLAAYQSMSPDKSQAAKLFRQAAARGHPGAQYYLAMIYERGAGVPKDMAAALDWYRQSATNGYAEAAVVLGNYYNEGLEVKRDFAAAFVWYSVAVAEGHRLAEAFRNGAGRKLTLPQLADAKERVAAILASRPKEVYTQAPSSTEP